MLPKAICRNGSWRWGKIHTSPDLRVHQRWKIRANGQRWNGNRSSHLPPHAYRQHESLKRRQYERVREIEHGSFTPLVFSATGGMAPLRQLLLPTKDLLLSWQTSTSRTAARRAAGSGAQSVFLWWNQPSCAWEEHVPPSTNLSDKHTVRFLWMWPSARVVSPVSKLNLYSLCGIPIFFSPPCFCWFVSYFWYIGLQQTLTQSFSMTRCV